MFQPYPPRQKVPSSWVCRATGQEQLGQRASDGQMLDDLLGKWHNSPERSDPNSNKQQQQARRAAWNARADTASQPFGSRPAYDDIIVLD